MYPPALLSLPGRDHLDLMFGPDAPPLDWDTQHEYSRDKIEIYYLSHAATPLSLDQLTEVRLGCAGWCPCRTGCRSGWAAQHPWLSLLPPPPPTHPPTQCP